tara:strand:+ start:794 stop:2572 length:1779 start_codon:yes stop_codon:yes gene_type:complete
MRSTQRHLRPNATRRARIAAIGFAFACAVAAAATLAQAGLNTGFDIWDFMAVALIALTTAWLAWGAAQAFLGLPALEPLPALTLDHTDFPATAILVPVCNENPVELYARLVAMRHSMQAEALPVDFIVLSDTYDPAALKLERLALAPLFSDATAPNRFFYRNRKDRHGRKAGNVEDFIRNSGGAYEYVVILDADSLMEGKTIQHLVARMQLDPTLGLLQTLPQIFGASSMFGRAMQFAASFHSAVFARGLARLQGGSGPFWGHNAIVRVRALAQCCALPELSGPAPFGGTILSHDYVEAALLVRGGWRVEMDPRIGGSYEEGPDNLLAHARRDRRWCQGNLQHIRLLGAPGLHGWSRFVFVQGIMAYLVSVAWGAFLVVSLLATATNSNPNYFPNAYQLFPVFPDDKTFQIVALAFGIGGLLLLPKITIFIEAVTVGRASGYGGASAALVSVLAEILLTAMIAPLMLMYQGRAVFEVFAGKDGGWPATARGEGRLSFGQSWRAGRWITLFGIGATALIYAVAPDLMLWLLPVSVPMSIAPALISITSRPLISTVFSTPHERHTPPVIRAYRAALAQPSAEKELSYGTPPRPA